jgi:hypothetical protein
MPKKELMRGITTHHAVCLTHRPSLLITRSVLGPNGLVLLQHVLEALAQHPAAIAAKLEALAILNAITALFVRNELTGGSAQQQRNADYQHHALAAGRHPRLAELLAQPAQAQAAHPRPALAPPTATATSSRTLNGILGPQLPSTGPGHQST